MIIFIVILIALIVISGFIISSQIKSIKRIKKDNKDLLADRARLKVALEDIQIIQKKAKDEKKKIDATDNSDIASILNGIL